MYNIIPNVNLTPARNINNRYRHNSPAHTSTIHSDKTCGVRYLGIGKRGMIEQMVEYK